MIWLRSIARTVFGDYALYRIYAIDAENCTPSESSDLEFVELNTPDDLGGDPEMRKLDAYLGEEAFGFGARVGDQLATACFFWTGRRYKQRSFWPLADNEAKLVEIRTIPQQQGKGAASRLIRHASHEMAQRGYQRLYSRIWHSNHASIRAFAKAGWRYIAFVTEVAPLGIKRWRWVRKHR
jgi:ribosomal protein S18 acetylase RimI-like enzyme